MKNIVQLMQNETDATDKINLDLSGNIKEREAMSYSTKESQKFPSNHEEIRSLGFAISKCEDVFDMRKKVDRLIEIVLKHEFNEQLEKMKLILEKKGDNSTLPDLVYDDAEVQLPILSRLHIPLTPPFISALLNEVIKLSEKYPHQNILKVKRYNGTTTTLVPVPEAKSKDSFNRNIRRKLWLNKLPECIYPSDTSSAVEWLIHELGSRYEDEFVLATKKLGYPIFTKKMDAVTAAAMSQASNVSMRSQRVILRYMANEFGSRLVVPATKISELGEKYVKPKCDTFILDKQKIHYWTKSLPTLLETSLKNRLGIESIDMDSFTSIDLVIGGDHGQGKFRCVMKVILRGTDGKNVNSSCLKVGHIDCDKDTYDVLKNSITTPLNNDIKEIMSKRTVNIVSEISTHFIS